MRYRLFFRSLILIGALGLFTACEEPPNEGSNGSTGQIHVVGTFGNYSTAFHWNDSTLEVLDTPDGDFHVIATSIVVSSERVVAGGSYDGKPCYWENGLRRSIDCDNGSIVAAAIDDSERLTLAGTCDDEVAVWVDGAKRVLPVSSEYVGNPTAMVIIDGSVYVAGSERSIEWSDQHACYWADDVITILPTPSNTSPGGTARATGITAVGDSVIVSGSFDADAGNLGAGYWINGAWNDLDGTTTRSMTMTGDTIYIAGRDSDGACYWVDDQKVRLQCEYSTIATAIDVSHGDVIVGGKCGAYGQNDHIGYWNNGDFNQIYENSNADVYGIFCSD